MVTIAIIKQPWLANPFLSFLFLSRMLFNVKVENIAHCVVAHACTIELRMYYRIVSVVRNQHNTYTGWYGSHLVSQLCIHIDKSCCLSA